MEAKEAPHAHAKKAKTPHARDSFTNRVARKHGGWVLFADLAAFGLGQRLERHFRR